MQMKKKTNEDVIMLSKEKIKEGLLGDFKKVAPSAFAIYLIIYAFSNDNKTSSVSMGTICRLTGLSFPSVQSTIQKMTDSGVIKTKKRGNRAFLYEIFP